MATPSRTSRKEEVKELLKLEKQRTSKLLQLLQKEFLLNFLLQQLACRQVKKETVWETYDGKIIKSKEDGFLKVSKLR